MIDSKLAPSARGIPSASVEQTVVAGRTGWVVAAVRDGVSHPSPPAPGGA